MSVILCPTRGGETSVPNQQWAIKLAKEKGADLIFLYISNVKFLDRISAPVLIDISEELDHLGEFILTMAQELGRKSGVEAGAIVRQGPFRKNLLAVIEENDVDTVVIGQSPGTEGVMTEEFRKSLAESLLEIGVQLYVLQDGAVIHHYRTAPSED